TGTSLSRGVRASSSANAPRDVSAAAPNVRGLRNARRVEGRVGGIIGIAPCRVRATGLFSSRNETGLNRAEKNQEPVTLSPGGVDQGNAAGSVGRRREQATQSLEEVPLCQKEGRPCAPYQRRDERRAEQRAGRAQ